MIVVAFQGAAFDVFHAQLSTKALTTIHFIVNTKGIGGQRAGSGCAIAV